MSIKKATFLISVADTEHILQDGRPEIAIAGKSNVGKSTFINYLCNNSKLARTSGDPGRTRLLNYFDIDNQYRLVDLPGYGYAKVSKVEQQKWANLIETYFAISESLKHVFVLVDIRHEPGNHDRQMIAYLVHYGIPFTVIATKADKLSKQQIKAQQIVLAKGLAIGQDDVIITSAIAGIGRAEVENRIAQILNNL